MGVNKALLIGNLGRDPELRYTNESRMAICTLNVATTEKRKGADGQWADQTEWHSVVTFGKTAENCAQYLKKGSSCYVEGRIQTRKWQDAEGKDKYRTEIVANTVQFLGGKRTGDFGGEGIEVERTGPGRSEPTFNPNAGAGGAVGAKASSDFSFDTPISFDDDDIPF